MVFSEKEAVSLGGAFSFVSIKTRGTFSGNFGIGAGKFLCVFWRFVDNPIKKWGLHSKIKSVRLQRGYFDVKLNGRTALPTPACTKTCCPRRRLSAAQLCPPYFPKPRRGANPMNPRNASRQELVDLTTDCATGVANGKVSGLLAVQNTSISDALTDANATLAAANLNATESRSASIAATQLAVVALRRRS